MVRRFLSLWILAGLVAVSMPAKAICSMALSNKSACAMPCCPKTAKAPGHCPLLKVTAAPLAEAVPSAPSFDVSLAVLPIEPAAVQPAARRFVRSISVVPHYLWDPPADKGRAPPVLPA